MVGCSQQLVAKVDQMLTTKNCESQKKVVAPDWVTDPHQQAAFRKLPAGNSGDKITTSGNPE